MFKLLEGGRENKIHEIIKVKATTDSRFSFKLTKIKDTELYKSIHGQNHQTLAESTTNVRIFVSYDETHFVTETRYTLYV